MALLLLSVVLVLLLEERVLQERELEVRAEGLALELAQVLQEVERVRRDLVLAQARLQVAQVEQNRESGQWKGMVD